jgi:hypothetical protein
MKLARVSAAVVCSLFLMPACGAVPQGGAASIAAIGRACSVAALPYKWGTAMERG